MLIMEFIEGTDLGRLVESRGPLPVGEACEYARQAALVFASLREILFERVLKSARNHCRRSSDTASLTASFPARAESPADPPSHRKAVDRPVRDVSDGMWHPAKSSRSCKRSDACSNERHRFEKPEPELERDP